MVTNDDLNVLDFVTLEHEHVYAVILPRAIPLVPPPSGSIIAWKALAPDGQVEIRRYRVLDRPFVYHYTGANQVVDVFVAPE
jgi:hypothetical protein